MNKVMFAGLALAAVLAMGVGQSMAAESAAMKACAAQWDEMKTKGTTPKGLTWQDFEKQCAAKAPAATAPAAPADKGKMAAPTPAPAPAAPAPTGKMAAPAPAAPAPAAPAANSKMAAPAAAAPAATGGTAGEHNREKMCSELYQADKAANKLGGKQWPQYWHECDTKLKAQGK